MRQQEAHLLLIRKKLMEQSGARLDDLETFVNECIEDARKTFISGLGGWKMQTWVTLTWMTWKGFFSKIQEGSKEVHGRKDQLIASHEKLIAVAIEGNERYWTLNPSIEMPPELKEKRWQIKPEPLRIGVTVHSVPNGRP